MWLPVLDEPVLNLVFTRHFDSIGSSPVNPVIGQVTNWSIEIQGFLRESYATEASAEFISSVTELGEAEVAAL